MSLVGILKNLKVLIHMKIIGNNVGYNTTIGLISRSRAVSELISWLPRMARRRASNLTEMKMRIFIMRC
jgi:hypothetical protein